MQNSMLRIYLIFGALAILGVIAGMNLPVSLFPNATKPEVNVEIRYGGMSAEAFQYEYGNKLESQLINISNTGYKVNTVTANYHNRSVDFRVKFNWGVKFEQALNEVQTVVNNSKATMPQEIADSASVWQWNPNTGFFSISFYSEKRGLNEVHEILDPVLMPKLRKIEGVDELSLYNPAEQELLISLDQFKLANLGIKITDINKIIDRSFYSYTGTTVRTTDSKLSITVPKNTHEVNDIKNLLVPISKNKSIALKELGRVELKNRSDKTRIFKTNGQPSIILWAKPKGGGNVKELCEKVLKAVVESKSLYPSDIKYKVLVDPSEFIRSAISNVFKEVFLAASLAVLILFLFIGDIRNVVTAAIEIPISIILAFIMMKITGMNLNLISLGGLALAAGMNVDASIVVLENIFRNQELLIKKGINEISLSERINLIIQSVKEVALPIVVSVATTLIVFTPLVFTSDLTNAILGDLAKAVIFSHGFSVFIALILVPVIRITVNKNVSNINIPKSPIEKLLKAVEQKYLKIIHYLMQNKKSRRLIACFVAITTIATVAVIFPKLPRELIGKPDSDWMIISLRPHSAKHPSEMEEITMKIEDDILKKYPKEIAYTFLQIRGERKAYIFLRLNDKHDMERLWKGLEKVYTNTPTMNFYVGPWNPAELPIPDPSHFEVEITGHDLIQMNHVAEKFKMNVLEKKLYPRAWMSPGFEHGENFKLTPYKLTWDSIKRNQLNLSPEELIDLTFYTRNGKKINKLKLGKQNYNVRLKFDMDGINSQDALESFPVKLAGKIIPLRALFDIKKEKSTPYKLRKDGRDVLYVRGRQIRGDEHKIEGANKQIVKIVNSMQEEATKTGTFLEVKDSKFELTKALNQTKSTLVLSLVLVILVLMMMFQSFTNVLTIMLAIPFGLLGVSISLYIFDSNLSLNSALGIILLNGIAVNNSILLIEFGNRLFKQGISADLCILGAAKKRLRPILITTLTTIIGMLPIALGLGEGGKILQPLGIAVSGGLWISTLLTLIFVPIAHYLTLRRKENLRLIDNKQHNSYSIEDLKAIEEFDLPSSVNNGEVLPQ